MLAFIFLSLKAQIHNQQMYAKVISASADLYRIPQKNSDKKFNYFKKGDMVPVDYCDRSNWCKVSNGYIHKKLLQLPAPILKNIVTMPKYKIKVIKEVVTVRPKVTPLKSPIAIVEKLPKPEIYAKVIVKHADLYKIPNKDAQRKANYFTEGDIIGLVYCDKSSWCKTLDGYVEKEFLSILDSKVEESSIAVTAKKVDKPTSVIVKKKVVVPNILHDNHTIYAKLLPSKANLYYKPYFNSKQSLEYFHKGDRIKIEYCNNYGWCKTTDGYIRQDAIILSKKLMKIARTNEPTEPIKYHNKQRVVFQKRVLPKQMVITKTKYVRVVEDIGEYKEYFKDDNAKVIFMGER